MSCCSPAPQVVLKADPTTWESPPAAATANDGGPQNPIPQARRAQAPSLPAAVVLAIACGTTHRDCSAVTAAGKKTKGKERKRKNNQALLCLSAGAAAAVSILHRLPWCPHGALSFLFPCASGCLLCDLVSSCRVVLFLTLRLVSCSWADTWKLMRKRVRQGCPISLHYINSYRICHEYLTYEI